ncbi:Glyoxylate/hydroxypyruvate reductase B [Pigmentiphaga humi]|uniref:Glyoxylate/hydroxypyruvate reductase B n=1 Tax=Pigmentiphaga humi TaxID=2478468 RepID=A0A3P4B6N7_9BURK|nr:D-2-hydroxyacid dehydrogenase [Pigmentiphaga humi]VCU71186.1 Glyoxylate/hydroxypyruvate reductase B [Pigmentiphaga humi]
MTILIVNADADYYRQRLARSCPDADIRAAASPEAAWAYLDEARALVAFASALSPAMIARARRLEWLQALSSGVDQVLAWCEDRPEVAITSTRGVQGPAVAEMAFMHMLALSRDLPRLVDNQRRAVWARYPQPLLHGKTVVIVGTGLIATELAARCTAFGMRVHGVSGTPRPLAGFERVHDRRDLPQAAALADFLVVLTPLSDQTHHLVDARVLSAIKPGAILVNLARGGVCDEAAVLRALREGRLGGAGLDVFETEPLPVGHPLWAQERVFVTPHLGGESDCYADQVLPILEANLAAFLQGRPQDLRNRVR